MTKKFHNQVVWITGASTGIGAELARQFVAHGAQVILSARRKELLEKLAHELGPQAHVMVLDVTKNNLVKQCAENIIKKLHKLDIVIANAGFGVRGYFEDLSEEEWRGQFETNFFGVVWTLQAALPYVKKSQGQIVIISSIVGKLALAKSSAYCSSKFALTSLAYSLYQELKPCGVGVTNIAPGLVESDIWRVNNLNQADLTRVTRARSKFVMNTQKAVNNMLKGISARKREIIITNHAKLANFLVAHFSGLFYWCLAKFGRS